MLREELLGCLADSYVSLRTGLLLESIPLDD